MTVKTNKAAIHGPTIVEKQAIVKHAKEIYTRLCLAEPVTKRNIQGHNMKAEMCIELAELFHQALVAKEYENE